MEKELFDQLKELLTEKFNHLEKTIQGIEDRNTEDHRTMKQQIGELFEENKKPIWFVGLGVGVASGIVSFVISLIK